MTSKLQKEIIELTECPNKDIIINKKKMRSILKKYRFGHSFMDVYRLENILNFPMRLDKEKRMHPTWMLNSVLTWVHGWKTKQTYRGSLYTSEQTSRLIGLKEKTIRNYRTAKPMRLRPMKVGKRYFYPHNEIERFLLNHRMKLRPGMQTFRKKEFVNNHSFI